MRISIIVITIAVVMGCAALSMPVKDQIKIGANVACGILQGSGCFDRLQNTLPGVGASTCSSVVGTLLDLAFMTSSQRQQTKAFGIETSKINFEAINIGALQENTGQTCEQIQDALGIPK
jgi:hypothetical protein